MDEPGVVIDLDRHGPPDASGVSRLITRHLIRLLAAVLAMGLVVSAGGSAPLARPPLVEVLAVDLWPIEEVPPPDSRVRADGPASPVVARMVDLASGRTLWTANRHVEFGFAPASDTSPAAVLAIGLDGGIEVRDARSGDVRHRLEWTEGEPVAVLPFDDLVLVMHTGPRLTTYSADLRQRRWQYPLPTDNFYLNGCGPMICERRPTEGYQVVDPATGTIAWSSLDQDLLIESGPHLLEANAQYTRLRSVDPLTGETLVDLSGWRPGSLRSASPPLPLLRRSADGRVSWLAVLEADAAAARVLGSVPFDVSVCQAVVGRIACRDIDELRLWRHR
nr:hypothetical protein [Micromonospora sp. DSM 115978]